MDVMDIVGKPIKEFAKDSYRLVKRCTKPDRKGTSAPSCAAVSQAAARRGLALAPAARVRATVARAAGSPAELRCASLQRRRGRRRRARVATRGAARRLARRTFAQRLRVLPREAARARSRALAVAVRQGLTPEPSAQSFSRWRGARGLGSLSWA
jgi:hypothetical protein